ncbi:MAG: hypothetical protein HN354_03995, partial [Deltaproteobacteria bacterium]|nr:hypothetical protein [Deltaproteobacteria bacterium]
MFLIATVIHLSLIAPLSQWLDRSLLPRLADQSLEIDLYEIQSNISPLKKKRKSPPKPLFKEQKKPVKAPEKIEDLKKPLEKIEDLKKPLEKIEDLKKPLEKIEDLKKPLEKIEDL